jgi:hypothetical protein
MKLAEPAVPAAEDAVGPLPRSLPALKAGEDLGLLIGIGDDLDPGGFGRVEEPAFGSEPLGLGLKKSKAWLGIECGRARSLSLFFLVYRR